MNGDPLPPQNSITGLEDVATNGVEGSVDGKESGPVNFSTVDGTLADPSTPLPVADSPLRGRKRKLADISSEKRARAISPPWKKVEADGPTSFRDESGRRKSGRTNTIPIEQQPPGDKRKTRGAQSVPGHDRRKKLVNGEHGLVDDSPVPRPNGYHKRGEGAHRSSSYPAKGRISQDYAQDESPRRNKPGPKPKHAWNSPAASQVNGRKKPGPKPKVKAEPSPVSKPGPKPGRKPGPKPKVASTLVPPDGTATTPPRKLKLIFNQNAPEHKSPGVRTSKAHLRWHFITVPMIHPLNFPRPKFSSFQEYLQTDDPLEDEDIKRISRTEARKEAIAINRVLEAAKPGGALSGANALVQEFDPDPEPQLQYTHADYLLRHVVDFQSRLQLEGRRHRAQAKRLAQACAEKWRQKHRPNAPDTTLSTQLALYKKTRNELLGRFSAIRNHIREQKLQDLLKQEQIESKKELQRLVSNSENLLRGRVRRTNEFEGSELEDDETASSGIGVASTLDEDDDDDDDDDDDESTSNTSEESANVDGDGDDVLTLEELRQKYADMPEAEFEDMEDQTSQHSATNEDTHQTFDSSIYDTSQEPSLIAGIDPAQMQLDEVDDVMLDSEGGSDESSDSGTEESEDEDESDGSGTGSGSEEEDDNPGFGLLGFLKPSELKQLKDDLPTKVEKEEKDETNLATSATAVHADVKTTDTDAEIDTQADTNQTAETTASTSDDPIHHDALVTSASNQASVPGSLSSIVPTTTRLSTPEVKTDEDAPLTPIPSLLRGTLRPYQHKGLDWLASMYDNSTNGILADEMGLGKTIQTIALLAHLATHHEIWGPHLVVVPTSVILNWEMEFKKFCPGFKILTYYGTLEERKAKRKGWMDQDRWNVCITSYQLAIQDQQSLKRKNWHFLILDEAHNIKNFRSQRWQTLLNFKSEARLLLTGTPLQNNLAELWSLLFFLAPEENFDGETSFGDLQRFSKTFRRPVEQILDSGKEALDDEAREIVTKLHNVLRPHLLRRLKSEVEKQMPKKYEHITVCRLSKRQRHLYNEYMSLAGTRESFSSGNYLSIINCLMQLRKVCNHPDLFETREIKTSYSMLGWKSAVADYEIKELLVRRRLLNAAARERESASLLNLWTQRGTSSLLQRQVRHLSGAQSLRSIVQKAYTEIPSDYFGAQSIESATASLLQVRSFALVTRLQDQADLTELRTSRRPLYSDGLLRFVTLGLDRPAFSRLAKNRSQTTETYLRTSTHLQEMVCSVDNRAEEFQPIVQRFTCVTPAVVAYGMCRQSLTDQGMDAVKHLQQLAPVDPYHEARIRQSIAFPDKTLIQYDCGKLQVLDKLLRKLQQGGHRALIFTQMTRVLDILEQFMNLHGHRYLRLDGATKIEQRQYLTERFNSDNRILAFILSSRSGGLGVNLTGADTVIFYDLDWNPAMDKQCQDRCHRIGQTRDVHIYRFVSEGTIEANILRKSNQKRILDDVVIQEGEFTTEHFNNLDLGEAGMAEAETDAALDRVLGGGGGGSNGAGTAGTGQAESKRSVEQAMGDAEDKEDQAAAREAQKEEVAVDDADFSDRPGSTPHTPTSAAAMTPVTDSDTTLTAPDPAAQQQPVEAEQQAQLAATSTQADEPARFVALESGALPQDKPVPPDPDDDSRSWEMAMYRFMAWAMKDEPVHLEGKGKGKKASKKAKRNAIRIRR